MATDLGFTPAWFAAGVLSPESAGEFAAYAAKDPSKSARHWRWLAFRDFAEEHVPLNEAECRALFQLGETEPDENLGTAMICCVLYQSACPSDLRDAAAASSREGVRRVVKLLHAV